MILSHARDETAYEKKEEEENSSEKASHKIMSRDEFESSLILEDKVVSLSNPIIGPSMKPTMSPISRDEFEASTVLEIGKENVLVTPPSDEEEKSDETSDLPVVTGQSVQIPGTILGGNHEKNLENHEETPDEIPGPPIKINEHEDGKINEDSTNNENGTNNEDGSIKNKEHEDNKTNDDGKISEEDFVQSDSNNVNKKKPDSFPAIPRDQFEASVLVDDKIQIQTPKKFLITTLT